MTEISGFTLHPIEIGCSRRGEPRAHPVAEVDRGGWRAPALGVGDVAADRDLAGLSGVAPPQIGPSAGATG
ncbi:MAG TPA: hypothetical protein VF516_25365 [Kofleriaceae bacterium]